MTKIFKSMYCFLFVLGVFFVLIGGYIFLKSEQAKTWPTTTGVIISSEMVKSTERGTIQFYSEVSYEYYVGSERYRGNKIGIGTTTDESSAKEYAIKYSLGKSVIVFYNVNDPSEALLEVSATPFIYYFLGIGIVFILISISMVYFKNEMLGHVEKIMSLFQKTKI